MSYWVNLFADGPHSSEIEQSGRIVSDYSRVYQYRTDMLTRPTEQQIVTDIGIVPGSPFPNDPNATCKKVTIGPGPTPSRPPFLCYHVAVEWATNAPVPNNVSTDPTTMRTGWKISSTAAQHYIVKDRDDEMILDAAKHPFDGGIPVELRLGVAVATTRVNASSFNQNSVFANNGKLNSTAYLGAAAKTLQVNVEASEHFEGSYHFWMVTYTFTYDPRGWQPKPMNAGFWHLVSGEPKRILNEDIGDTVAATKGDYVLEPQPLTNAGAVVPIASRPSGCNFIEVDYWDTFDFSTLNL